MRRRGLKHRAPLLALAGLAAVSPAALAQLAPDASAGSTTPLIPYPTATAAASQRGSAQEGGISLKFMDMLVTVHPSVRFEVQHDDNIYSTPNNRTADQVLVLKPAVRLETRQGANAFRLHLSSTIGQYQSNSENNYTNTNLNGLADLDLGTRLRARLEGDYEDGVDPRGSTNNPLSAAPDHYRQSYGKGVLSYGARGARGRLDLELGQLRRDYLNNRAVTAASDRVVDNLGATFNWRVGPKTTLLFQGKQTKIDYVLPISTLGSTEHYLLAGATWEASAKTTGTFRIGVVTKDFEDSTRGNSRKISWTGEVRWSPRTYSHVDLILNRAPAETSGGVGNFIDRTSAGARWSHAWSSRLTTEASASYATDAYQGAARTDNTQKYGFRADYKMRRWLSFGGDYVHTIRSSDDNNFDYKRNVFMLFVHATL